MHREEVLSMSEQFNYRSVLAPYMRLLLEVKASAGINAQRMKWILKEFDDFAVSVNLTDPHVTSEFISMLHRSSLQVGARQGLQTATEPSMPSTLYGIS